MQKINFKTLIPIVAISVIPSIFLWLPFFFRLPSFWKIPLPEQGMATVVANYDGPLYILVAKTFYNPDLIQNLGSQLPSTYFAAHFPLFPLVIKIISFITGYPYALLIATVLSSILATYFFHKFISEYVPSSDAWFLTLTFSVFPARWLIVKSVGSAEPLFIAGVLASVYFFQKKKYVASGIWGALAQLTKSPGILLFIAYFLYLFFPKLKRAAISTKEFLTLNHFRKFAGLLVIPLSLLLVFTFYQIRMGDFWAYFHSGDNIHLFFPPFQIFNYSAPWVGTFWLEEIIFVYTVSAFGIAKLVEKKQHLLAWICSVFFVSLIFVSHRDLIRYALPIFPLLMVGFSETLISKEFKATLIFIILPIYLFSLAFISQNTLPISDWAQYL